MTLPCRRAATRRLILLASLSWILISLASAQDPAPLSAPAPQIDNFARGFSGASILVQDRRSGNYVPDISLNSVIDDDVASGWTPPTGRSRLLITLTQAANLEAITLYAPDAVGTYSVSTAVSLDDIANDRTAPITRNIDLREGERTPLLADSSSYLAIELNVTQSAPLRGLKVGGKPVGDPTTTTVVSPANTAESEETAQQGEVAEVNFALKALGGAVAGEQVDEFVEALIDGDTGTASEMVSAERASVSTTIHLASAVDIDRVTLAVGFATGTLSIFTSDESGAAGRLLASTTLDGTREAFSFETDGVRAEFVQLVWEPQNPGDPLQVKEVGVFALARVERTVPPGGSGPVVVTVVPTFSNLAAGTATPAMTPRINEEFTESSSPPAPVVPIEPRPVSG